MKKLYLIVSLLCSAVLGASAQDYETPSDEISVSWGVFSCPNMIGALGLAFSSVVTEDIEYGFATGSITAQYMHNLNDKWGIGISASYESVNAKQKEFDWKDKYVSIMPTARYRWSHKGKLGMYSRVAAGVTINSYEDHSVNGEAEKKTDTVLGWQVSPLGIEYGNKKVSGFFEVGWGYQGLAIAGVRLGL